MQIINLVNAKTKTENEQKITQKAQKFTES